MKKITSKQMMPLIILLGFFSTTFVSIKAQCIRPDAFGTVVSNNSGLLQGITTCDFSTSEYSTVTGLTLGEDYVFNGQVGTVYGAGAHIYVTITDLSNTVIQHGMSPQTVTNIAVAGVRIHLSDDAACAGSAVCHNTSVLLITSCIVPSGLSSTNVTTTTADISWTAPVNVPSSGYDYYYSTTNYCTNCNNYSKWYCYNWNNCEFNSIKSIYTILLLGKIKLWNRNIFIGLHQELLQQLVWL